MGGRALPFSGHRVLDQKTTVKTPPNKATMVNRPPLPFIMNGRHPERPPRRPAQPTSSADSADSFGGGAAVVGGSGAE